MTSERLYRVAIANGAIWEFRFDDELADWGRELMWILQLTPQDGASGTQRLVFQTMTKVTAVRRGRRVTPIRNGAAGRLCGQVCHTRKQLAFRVSTLCHPLYRRLADSGILRLPPRWLGVRVVRLQGKQHIVLYALLWGRWTIGRYAPGDQEWHIRRPFRLFLDADTLPTASLITRTE